MKKLLATFLALLSGVMTLPMTAYALPQDLRPRPTYEIVVPGIPLRNTTEVTVGTNGVIARFVAQGAAGSLTPNFTTGISGIPYPSRLQVIMIDVTTNDTLACTSVTLQGFDQFGRAISETVNTVTETGQLTVRAFSKVTRVSGVACGGGTEATDFLRISTSMAIGLPIKTRSVNDIHSACFVDASASNDVVCYSAANLSAASAYIANAALVPAGLGRADVYVVDMAAGGLATAMADGDSLILRIYQPDPLN